MLGLRGVPMPLTLFLLLVACKHPGADSADSADSAVTTESGDTGRVCPLGEITSGYGNWTQAGNTRKLLVYGDSAEDVKWAQKVFDAWYSQVTELEMVPASAMTDLDRAANLMIFGTPEEVPLLADLNDSLPVEFYDGYFTFGGYTYDRPSNGIALLGPNPNVFPGEDQGMVLMYAGNSIDAAKAAFYYGYPSADHYDYMTFGGLGTLQYGNLCHDGTPWWLNPDWQRQDYWPLWLEWFDQLEEYEGIYHHFFYLPGSAAADDIEDIAAYEDAGYENILVQLDVPPIDYPIDTFFYPDPETLAAVEGIWGAAAEYCGTAWLYQTNEVYGDAYCEVTGEHEDMHVVSSAAIDWPNSRFVTEGLAMWGDADGRGQAQYLDEAAAEYQDAGEIPPLEEMLTNFDGADVSMTYIVGGSFMGWVRETYGTDALKEIFMADDIDATFVAQTALDTEGINQAWLDSLP